MEKRTKIIATVGPASNTYDKLLELIEAGVNVFRLNFSHGTHEEHQKVVNYVRDINEKYDYHVALLQDLQGPKIRTNKMPDNGIEYFKGDIFKIITKDVLGTKDVIGTSYLEIPRDVEPGAMILVDDGKIELKVLSTNRIDEVVVEVVHGGIIKSFKGINLPFTKVSTPSLTEKDLRDLEFGVKNNIEWIALSFARKAQDVLELKKLIKEKNASSKVIAKVENPEAIDNIDEIIASTDAVMVARGDLGVEIYLEEVPMVQKMIIHKCNELAKPVIVATQMMESMITSLRPTRAETNDVANAVMDGADALMLSGETAVGAFPVEVIKSMSRTIVSVESQSKSIYHKNIVMERESKTYFNDNVVHSACMLGRATEAKALVGMTSSGYTAFQISSHRPEAAVYIFTNNKFLLNVLSLVWGVKGIYYDKFTSTDETIDDIEQMLLEKNQIKSGDVFISLASTPLEARKRTNMIKLNIVD
jgi:pyruvate kinase